MLPPNLTSQYRQYKTDTDRLATWLVVTAQKNGFNTDQLHTVTVADKAKKLKGRARMLAKQAEKAGPSNNQAGPTKAVSPILAQEDFPTLARHVASAKAAAIKVPTDVASSLDRAIDLRRRVGAFFNAQNAVAVAEASSEQPSALVDMLEDVRDILEPCLTTKTRTNAQSNGNGNISMASGDGLAKLFSSLKVEDTVEAPVAGDVSQAQPNGSVESPQYTMESSDNLQEALVAFTCLVDDLRQLQDVVNETWIKYKEGGLDIVAAAITSNTAIEFARRMEEEQKTVYATHGGSEKLLDTLYKVQCSPSDGSAASGKLDFDQYATFETFFWSAHTILKGYRDESKGNVITFKPASFATYRASQNRADLSAEAKFKEDETVLRMLLPELGTVAVDPPEELCKDEFTEGLTRMFKTNEISLSLTFAAQIFLDIHHILREKVRNGFDDLINVGGGMANSVTTTLQFHKELQNEKWPLANNQVLESVLDAVRGSCGEDPVKVAYSKRFPKQAHALEAHHLLKNHPMACGLQIYVLKTIFRRLSIAFANAWGSILSVAHLYTALKQERPGEHHWVDMELLLNVQRRRRLFSQDLSRDPDQYFRRYCAAMGITPSDYAQKGVHGQPIPSTPTGPRRLEDLAFANFIFQQRYVNDEEGAGFDEDDVKIIMALNPVLIPADEGRERITTLVQLLDSLRDGLQSEAADYSFDYLLMHKQCWMALQIIKGGLEEQLRHTFGLSCLALENQLPLMVGYIFMSMVSDEVLAKSFDMPNVRHSGARASNELFNIASQKTLVFVQFDVESLGVKIGGMVACLMQRHCNVKVDIQAETTNEAVSAAAWADSIARGM